MKPSHTKLNAYQKCLKLGHAKYDGKVSCPVEITVKLDEFQGDSRTIDLDMVDQYTLLSICGYVWMPSRRDIYTGGQCTDTIRSLAPQLKNTEQILRLCDIWDLWHNNELNAGTREQRNLVNEWTKTNRYDYPAVCKFLSTQSLLIDRNYQYGSQWLLEPMPTEIINEIKTICESLSNA